ncbi:MAG TPA: hypothetical protein VMW25_00480 [Clostridia bacterium]|nr:hypothetical protein [Clostridia bacterium]
MVKVNLRKAASWVAKENTGKDINVADAAEAIKDFIEYLLQAHEYSEILEMLEKYE